MGGLGFGPLVACLLAEYAPLPIRLPFLVDLLLIASAAVGVWLAPETVQVAARPQLAPQRLQVPQSARTAFVPAAIAGFAGFAVLGLFTAVAPSFLGRLLNLPNHALIGSTFFIVIYVAISVPVIGVGLMAERYGLRRAGIAFAAAMGLLAAIALVLIVLRRDRAAPRLAP